MEKTLTDQELEVVLKVLRKRDDSCVTMLDDVDNGKCLISWEVAYDHEHLSSAISKLEGCEEVVIHSKN